METIFEQINQIFDDALKATKKVIDTELSEQRKPKRGGYAIFYDNLKWTQETIELEEIRISQIGKITYDGYRKNAGSHRWKNVFVINMNEPLQLQIDKFLKLEE